MGCNLTDVINNTIINPENWVVRILQETVDPERFISCGDNSFQNNIIYFSDVSTETNIGPNTRPQSFFYDSNLWFHHKNSNWRGPDIPVIDSKQVINRDPLFRSIETQDFTLQSDSPAIGLSFYNGEPRFDFNGMAYNSPRSVGAFEGNPETGLNLRQHLESGFSCDVYPNPFNGVSVFRYCVRFGTHTSLKIYDVTGRQVTELVDEVKEPGQYEIALNLTYASSGVYIYRLVNGTDRLVGKLILLR